MGFSSDIIVECIQKQIDAAKPIMDRIDGLVMVRSSGSFDDARLTAGRVKYYKSDVRPIENEIKIWNKTSLTVIKMVFPGDDKKRNEFDDTIVRDHVYSDAKLELETEVKEGVAVLNSFLTEMVLKMDLGSQVENSGDLKGSQQNVPPKVFISHSSKDKTIIQSFVENVLVLGLGLNNKDIAFTSQEVYGIEPGVDIINYIRDNIASAGVVLLMISSGYKKSEICLNEMGAAWALGKNCISVLLPDADFSQLGWLTSFKKAIKVNDKDQMYSLCQRIAKDLSIDLVARFTSTSSYLDKFLSFAGESERNTKFVASESSDAILNLDEVIINAINKLREFTLKELQTETGIQDFGYLEKKINEMVLSKDLEMHGPIYDPHYRKKTHLSIKL